MVRWGPNDPAEVMPALSHGWWKGWRGPKPLTADFHDRGRGFDVLSVHPRDIKTRKAAPRAALFTACRRETMLNSCASLAHPVSGPTFELPENAVERRGRWVNRPRHEHCSAGAGVAARRRV